MVLYPQIAESLYWALADDPFYNQLEQQISASGRDGHTGMLHYYDFSMRLAQASGGLTLPQPVAGWGAAIWSLPHAEATALQDDKPAYFIEHLGQRAYQHYRDVCDSMDRLSSPHVQSSYWYLSILGVTPARQGQGLGRQLLEPILEQADASQVATFLETFVPRNISFYERYGYRTAAILHEPVLKTDYHLLVREPAG